jgi:hypothetical protein
MKRFIHSRRLSAVRASVFKLVLLGLMLNSQGCGGGDTGGVEAWSAFFISAESKQCDRSLMTVAKRNETAEALKAQGVMVDSASCAKDGLPKILVCGADAGEGFLVQVSAGSVGHPALQTATAASKLPNLQNVSCSS